MTRQKSVLISYKSAIICVLEEFQDSVRANPVIGAPVAGKIGRFGRKVSLADPLIDDIYLI